MTVLPLPAGADTSVMPPATPDESNSKSLDRATTSEGRRTSAVRSGTRMPASSHAAERA